MEEPFESYDEGVAFSMDFSTLGRINYWLWTANKAQVDNNVNAWLQCCKTLWKEADPYMKVDERLFHEGMYTLVLKSYKQYLHYEGVYAQNRQKMAYAPPRKIFDLLFEWEMEIRRVLDAKGILMKKGEDATRAMI